MGDLPALFGLLVGSLGLLAAAIAVTSRALSRNATTVAGLPTDHVITTGKAIAFRRRSQSQTLRAKEWTLLWRDPWLVSQSLMQILYLLPPALLLWRDLGTNADSLVVLVPVLVMASGQLAGGLAWLAISGEDAPDLVTSAPISRRAILRAKTEAVMIAVGLPILPIAAAMAYVAPSLAGLTILGAAFAAAGSSAVQFFFRSHAKRSNFRRRQTSSRFATFAEAFLSISVAAAAGLAAAGFWSFALVPVFIAIGVLGLSRAIAGEPAAA